MDMGESRRKILPRMKKVNYKRSLQADTICCTGGAVKAAGRGGHQQSAISPTWILSRSSALSWARQAQGAARGDFPLIIKTFKSCSSHRPLHERNLSAPSRNSTNSPDQDLSNSNCSLKNTFPFQRNYWYQESMWNDGLNIKTYISWIITKCNTHSYERKKKTLQMLFLLI